MTLSFFKEGEWLGVIFEKLLCVVTPRIGDLFAKFNFDKGDFMLFCKLTLGDLDLFLQARGDTPEQWLGDTDGFIDFLARGDRVCWLE